MVPLIKENKKIFMERKWKKKYHVHDDATVELKDVKMYCNTNQFPSLSFMVHISNLMAQGG